MTARKIDIVLVIFRKENKMELNSKDELLSTLDEILNRLTIVEQSSHEKPEKPEEPEEPEETKEEPEVETEDEIEKLLNA